MSEPDFERIRSIALDVRRAHGPIRQSMIESRCGDDPQLRREVELLVVAMNGPARSQQAGRLIDAIEGPGGLLDPSRLDEMAMDDAALVAAAPPPEPLPRTAGEFVLQAVIGRGASAVVYRAEQASPRRTVALKLLDPPRSSRAMRRFRQEADALARLDHPGIARIHAAGVLADGDRDRPYLAMELVSGPAFERAAFVGDDRTAARAIIAAMADVADAVHHAHLRGVIHRDLKAANIRLDDNGQPKVLDFGVARLLAGDDGEPLTEAGHLIGTVRSMSPEQVAGDPRDVDARTDVHALGLLLYELLAGRMPYDLDDRSLAGAAMVIRDAAPAPLAVRHLGLSDDLTTVVATALAKDPADRHPSAAAFAGDLRAVLNHRPVSVRPASRGRRARLFVRRHRGPVLLATVATAGLVAATAISLNFATDAARAAAASRRDEAISERTRGHLEQLLTAMDTHTGGSGPRSPAADDAANAMLAAFVADLDASDEWPEVSAGVRSAVGRVLLSRRQVDAAATQLAAAADVQRGIDPRSADLAVTLAALGNALAPAGDSDRAEAAFRESIAIRQHHLDAGTWTSTNVTVPGTPTVTDARPALVELLLRTGRQADAAPLVTVLVTESIANGDAERHPVRLNLRLRHAARIAAAAGDLTAAERDFDRAAALVSDLPADHPVHLAAELERSHARASAGDLDGASDASAVAFEHAAVHLDAGSFDWMVAFNTHLRHLRQTGRTVDLRTLLERGRALVHDQQGPEHRLVGEFDRMIGRLASTD